jgi:hypothetical protein
MFETEQVLWFRIRIQHFKLIRTQIQTGSRVLLTKIKKKNTDDNYFIFLILIKNCNLLIPRPP